MRKAIILHGMPSKEQYLKVKGNAQSNSHWLPWLQQQLLLNGILAQTPEMPEPYAPVYEAWRKTFEQFDIDEKTDLVGHSCGAGFLVRWLSENKVKVGKVALVAPWLDPNKQLQSKFFEFELDKDFAARTSGVHQFVSTDDEKEMLTSVDMLRNLSDIKTHTFADQGHFTYGDMKTEEFPELLETLLST